MNAISKGVEAQRAETRLEKSSLSRSALRHPRLRQCLARAIAIALGLSLAGCATTTKEKILQNTIIAASAGAALGYSSSSLPVAHALMYGASAAAITAIASVYYYDQDKEVDKLKIENAKFKQDLDSIGAPKVIAETPATFNARVPEKYRALINPGTWRISEIDQWSEDGENRLTHQDKIMELIPPTLNPNQKGTTK